MAEREIYNPETGNFELIPDDGIYETNPYTPMGPGPSAPPPDKNAWLYDPNATPPASPVPGQQWRWTGNQWTLGPAAPTQPQDIYRYGPGTGNDENGPMYGGGGGGGDGDFGGMEPETPFDWSQFSPQRFRSLIGPYVSPTLQEAENEPGYAFARDQGRKALENSAAGRGVLRTGGTLKDILQFGNKFGEQNYQAVDSRKFRNWGANRDLEFGEFDRNYRGEQDSFNARRESEKLNFGDLYARWKSRLDSLTNIATAGLNS